VSAYAQAGHRCWHNTNYWQFGDYLGVGAGAHSKISFAHRVMRMVRYRDPKLYMQKAMGEGAVTSVEEISRAQLPFEFMLNALRLKDGFDVQSFLDRTGLPVSAIDTSLDKAVSMGLLDRDMHQVRPTERGFDMLNDLQAFFLAT
jgi:oxygen-independent coproporphyrinogen-3 oxidase